MQPLRIRKLANAWLYGGQSAVNGIVPMGTAQWIGGTVEITEDLLWFGANGLNQAVVGNVGEVHIPTASLASVEYQFGWFTGIVIVRHDHGEFRFRCYGAKNLVATLHMLFVAPKAKVQPAFPQPPTAEHGHARPTPGARPLPGRRQKS